MKLYRTGGTTNEQFFDTTGDPNSFGIVSEMTAVGTDLYIVTRGPDSELRLHQNAGTYMTRLVSNTSGDSTLSDSVGWITRYGSGVYFLAVNAAGKAKMFVYTESHVAQVTNLNDGENDFDHIDENCSETGSIHGVFQDRLLFNAVIDGDTGCTDKLMALCDSRMGCDESSSS